MNEKRFEINNLVKKGNMSFWDNENKSILNVSHTLDLLNNLSGENGQLKAELEFWKKQATELEYWKKQAKQCPMRSCK